MIERREAIVYYAPTAKRRYLTRRAAVSAEARAIIKDKYPNEDTEHDDSGRCTYPGWCWRELNRSEVLHRRLCRLINKEGK